MAVPTVFRSELRRAVLFALSCLRSALLRVPLATFAVEPAFKMVLREEILVSAPAGFVAGGGKAFAASCTKLEAPRAAAADTFGGEGGPPVEVTAALFVRLVYQVGRAD